MEFLNHLNTYLQSSPSMAFIVAFVGGLLTSFTPCVYPMVPITASYVGSNNVGGSKVRGFFLSLIFVTGVAVTYAGLGIFAALSGRFFGEINSNPYVYLVVGNIILLFALGMLDVYTIPMFSPQPGETRKGCVGLFVLGMTSGLVAGPCTAPVLGTLLTFVSTTKNVFYGGGLLFVFAFGMGATLLAVGTFSGMLAALPKSGMWLVRVKKFLGLIMVILAEYFIIKGGKLFF